MSTKLYEGFRLKGVSSIEDALSFIDDIKEPIKERILSNMATEIKTLACLMYDLHGLGYDMFEESEDDRVPLLSATMRTLKNDPKHDESFSVGLTSVEGQVLGYPFFPENGYVDIIFEHIDVERFGYWDNTDPDETVTKEEWEKRKRLWNKVFERDSIFNRSMFIITLADKRNMIPTDEHMKELPTMEQREKATANQLAWAEVAKNYEPDLGKLYDLMVKVKEITPTHLEQVKGKLKEDITIKTLEQPLPQIKENNKDGSEGISEISS